MYGAAHHAAEFLVARYGEARVLDVIAADGRGSASRPRSGRRLASTDAEFASDFRRYVVWQGWARQLGPLGAAAPALATSQSRSP